MAMLTTSKRESLPMEVFAIPETRSYPIHDESHARNALTRVSQFGSPEEKSRVRSAVARRFPGIVQDHDAGPYRNSNTKNAKN